MEQLEHSHIAGRSINGVTTLEINLEISHKVEKCLAAFPLLSIYSKEINT